MWKSIETERKMYIKVVQKIDKALIKSAPFYNHHDVSIESGLARTIGERSSRSVFRQMDLIMRVLAK